MSELLIEGRSLVGGEASGETLFSDVPISFWMGVDPATGIVIDRHHPLHGSSVAGKIVCIPGGRGSCSASGGILELIESGRAPAALVFAHADAILTLGVIMAEELFRRSLPVIAAGAEQFRQVRGHPRLWIRDGFISSSEAGAEARPRSTLGPSTLDLADRDRAMLAGAEGPARRTAMKIILRMAEIEGAHELVDITRAHIDACFYTGPGGLALAEKFVDLGGRVKVPTTTNAISADRRRWRAHGVAPALGEASCRVADAYVRMGAEPSFTCAPYLLADPPKLGEQIGWAESNAVAFANSVLGARTAKYPDYLDLCVALTGRAPKVETHLDAGRLPTLEVRIPRLAGRDDSFYPLLGYHVGQLAAREIPLITGLEDDRPTPDDLKAFCAAFATTSAAPMAHILGVTPEASGDGPAVQLAGRLPLAEVSRADLAASYRELDRAADGSVHLVALGNPHFSLTEFARMAELCRGRTKSPGVAVIVTCGRNVHAAAAEAGHVSEVERFGAQIVNDTCWCMTGLPALPPSARTVLTNSAKYAHYGPGISDREFAFASLAASIDAAESGARRRALPAWLAA